MIRSTSHSLKFSNTNKLNVLYSFIKEYRTTAKQYLNYLWNHKINYTIQSNKHHFDIQNDVYSVPNMLPNKQLEENISDFHSKLSARAKKCCLTQVLGIIKSSTKKQNKRLYILKQLQKDNQKPSESLLKKIKQNKPVKPDISNLNPELNSICCNFIDTKNHFNGFLCLSSLGKTFEKLYLPIQFHRNNNKYKSFKRKSSFLINEKFVNIRWEKTIKPKTKGKTVGADQGKIDVLTLSDNQTTPKTDIHNHSLNSIIDKLSRKKKGSKAFAKAQEHRKNFIKEKDPFL